MSRRATGHLARELTRKTHAPPQDPQLDSIMFRKGPGSETLKKGTNLALHPLLNATDMMFEDTAQAEIRGAARELIAEDYKAVYEFATNPSTTEVALELSAVLGKVRNSKGVTVKDVLRKVAVLWSAPDDNAMQFRLEALYDDSDGEYPDSDVEEVSMLQGFFEHQGQCTWAGWEATVVDNAGRAVLEAADYKS